MPQIPNPGPSFPVFFERETNNGERRQAGSVGGAKIVRVLLALLKKVRAGAPVRLAFASADSPPE